MQIPYIRTIDEQTASPANTVDNRPVHSFRDSRTTFTAAQETSLADILFTDIIGGMHDDAPMKGIIIPPFFFTLQPERIAMLPHERLSREIKPKAAHKAVRSIGKAGSE